MSEKIKIWIPNNVSSSKNSKQIFQMPIKGVKACPMCGHKKSRPILVYSKTAKKYVTNTQEYWMMNRVKFKEMIKDVEKPYRLSFEFIRDSKRKFDYINALQIVQDLMVKYKWIEEDNCDNIIPSFITYSVDKVRAGVIISLTE